MHFLILQCERAKWTGFNEKKLFKWFLDYKKRTQKLHFFRNTFQLWIRILGHDGKMFLLIKTSKTWIEVTQFSRYNCFQSEMLILIVMDRFSASFLHRQRTIKWWSVINDGINDPTTLFILYYASIYYFILFMFINIIIDLHIIIISASLCYWIAFKLNDVQESLHKDCKNDGTWSFP